MLSITTNPCSNRGIVTGVSLRISDTGRGMSAETMARASDPFFTTKPDGCGNGLGLARVRRFAQETGGEMAIESKLGRGTTVTLWLPQQSSPRR